MLVSGCHTSSNNTEYLKRVLSELDKINYASYNSIVSSSAPEDSLEFKTFYKQTEEYNNPADTTIGSSFYETMQSDNIKNSWTYDGKAFTYILWGENRIRIDSFKTNTLSFRPVTPPFFSQMKSIIKYSFETKDSIVTSFEDYGDTLKFSLYIPKKVVEFLGRPIAMDNPYLSDDQEFSRYDIWIDKSSCLPFRNRRKMPHQTSWENVRNVEFNKKDIADFKATDYFPKDFEINFKGTPKKVKNELLEKIAPDWILKDVKNNAIALKDLKSKVLVIQFTGIGCGPCHESIPFSKELVKENVGKDFEFICIETWSNNLDGIERYCKANDLTYKFLISDKDITKNYNVDAVPIFYVLDKNRIIKKIIRGYGKGNTDKEIREAVRDLI
jgi:thiol-disulfide isomerase/thioredoxin